MKQVRLLRAQPHERGGIEKGSIYNWNEEKSRYEFERDGIVISTVNEAAVDMFTDIFERVEQDKK